MSNTEQDINWTSSDGEMWTLDAQNGDVPTESPREGTFQRLSFLGLWLFTLLLYARPSDLFPNVVAVASVTKVVACLAVVTFVVGRFVAPRRQRWPVELKMVLFMTALAVILMPFAQSLSRSLDFLANNWLKVVCIFFLLVNLVDSRGRLRKVMTLIVTCGTVMAVFAVRSYAMGDLRLQGANGDRITGAVGGIFFDPNDLATTFNILLPMAFALGLTSRGLRRLLWLGAAGALAGAVIVTFSRGGFLALTASIAFQWWRLVRRPLISAIMLLGLLLGAASDILPQSYVARLDSMFVPLDEADSSRQERTELLKHAVDVAFSPRHAIVGVGFANYNLFSLHDKGAHNAYLETSAELGIAGLAAYLVMLLAPFGPLRRIERETARAGPRSPWEDRVREMHYLSIGLQSSILAYMVCSFFLSIEYGWYVYYPIALAVGLRHIHAESVETGLDSPLSVTVGAPANQRWPQVQAFSSGRRASLDALR